MILPATVEKSTKNDLENYAFDLIKKFLKNRVKV